jgi:hypothetical protein
MQKAERGQCILVKSAMTDFTSSTGASTGTGTGTDSKEGTAKAEAEDWTAAIKLAELEGRDVDAELLSKAADSGGIPFNLSVEIRDRDNDVVEIDGIKLANFRRNPVMLRNHNHDTKDTIGTWTPVWKDADARNRKRLRGVANFADTEAGKATEELVRFRVLRAASIGIRPLKAERDLDAPEGSFGVRFKESDLYEGSVIPVPANQLALADLSGKALDAARSVILPAIELALDGDEAEMALSLGIRAVDAEAIRKTLKSGPTIVVPEDLVAEDESETALLISSTVLPAPAVSIRADASTEALQAAKAGIDAMLKERHLNGDPDTANRGTATGGTAKGNSADGHATFSLDLSWLEAAGSKGAN